MAFFRVITEFFECEWSEVHNRSFLNEAADDQKALIRILKDSIGIYSFYNSELEIIYIGKTKNNLWDEMKNAYNRHLPHYYRYYVQHPNGKFKTTSSGNARKIQNRQLYVYETATYFSAYSVDRNMIDDVEKFMIRLMPNDLINVRMEGNGSLEAQASQEDSGSGT